MFKKIMVATDGSQTSIRTAELAVGLARLSGGSIIAIYVVDVYRLAHLPGYAAFPSLGSRLMELMLREGELAISEVENMAAMQACLSAVSLRREIPARKLSRDRISPAQICWF